jgi:hypothetical protein
MTEASAVLRATLDPTTLFVKIAYCIVLLGPNPNSVICDFSFVIRGSGRVNSKLCQQAGDRFHRQANDVGERPVDSLDYGFCIDLCSITSRFVERIKPSQVSADRVRIQLAKLYFGFDHCGDRPSIGEIANSDRGDDIMRSAGKPHQHTPSIIEIDWFAEYGRSHRYESVRAENHSIWLGPSHRKRLPASIQKSQFAGSKEVYR